MPLDGKTFFAGVEGRIEDDGSPHYPVKHASS
jgi:hypothetical protein